MFKAVEKKKNNQNKRNYSTWDPPPHILAFPMLHGQPPKQSPRSSGETRIARLTTPKNTLFIPSCLATGGKIMRMITDKIA